MQDSVAILSTGGTIDKVYFDASSDYQVGEPQIIEILRIVGAQVPFTVENIFRKDSLELTDDDRREIAERVRKTPSSRVLITHGTDTMVNTARELTGIEGKTIVLVGSLTPARFKNSDAEFNIGFAIAAVQTLPPGVWIAMNGRVFAHDQVRKNKDLNRFEPA
ncbi:MAG: asparaginase [Rhodothermales bacterium]|nr:asparaginase [Rhodothermales bacterium]